MQLNRVVALLTPIVAAGAGTAAAWVAEKLPGLDRGELEAIFIAGILAVLAPAAQWLYGWQKYEGQQADIAKEVALANAAPPELLAAEPLGDESFFDEEGMFDELDEIEVEDELDEIEALMGENGS
jgi:hypothetical protein